LGYIFVADSMGPNFNHCDVIDPKGAELIVEIAQNDGRYAV